MIKELIYKLIRRYGDDAQDIAGQYHSFQMQFPDIVADIAHRGYVFTTTADKSMTHEQILINEGRRQLALEILRLCDPNLPNIIYQTLNAKKIVRHYD